MNDSTSQHTTDCICLKTTGIYLQQQVLHLHEFFFVVFTVTIRLELVGAASCLMSSLRNYPQSFEKGFS